MKLMKFTELAELADRLSEKLGKYVTASVTRKSHKLRDKETEYELYIQDEGFFKFKTATGLRAHMENLLDPNQDEGLELETEVEHA